MWYATRSEASNVARRGGRGKGKRPEGFAASRLKFYPVLESFDSRDFVVVVAKPGDTAEGLAARYIEDYMGVRTFSEGQEVVIPEREWNSGNPGRSVPATLREIASGDGLPWIVAICDHPDYERTPRNDSPPRRPTPS